MQQAAEKIQTHTLQLGFQGYDVDFDDGDTAAEAGYLELAVTQSTASGPAAGTLLCTPTRCSVVGGLALRGAKGPLSACASSVWHVAY